VVLYPVRYTKEGRRLGEFPVGTVVLAEGQIVVDVPDKKIRAKVEELFGQPFKVRVPRGNVETVLGHSWQELSPGHPLHFQEGLRRLLRLDLMARQE